MDLTPLEAQQALEAIQNIANKTRKVIANSGAYAFLIIWGFVWLIGFSANQFLVGPSVGYAWMVLDIVGALLSVYFGIRLNRKIRSDSNIKAGRRIGYFWLLLFAYCLLLLLVVSPLDMKKGAMVIVLFVMIGWIAMGLLMSAASIWWALVITALALFGYFLLPSYFYLWMAVLGGGGMIALGIYIRSRW